MDRHRRHLARSAPTATIPKASGSARKAAATAARSRSGTSANSAISTTTRELGTRNIKVALRRLRRFAREGAADELDLDGTIDGTARQGWLDVRMRPERHNAVKLLLFLDVGGSMDRHVRICEELFSAARSRVQASRDFYFHNCLYEGVWKDNRRRFTERTPTWDVLHKFGHDYKLVIVGDASMSPYEISHPGGSVEHITRKPARSGSSG